VYGKLAKWISIDIAECQTAGHRHDDTKHAIKNAKYGFEKKYRRRSSTKRYDQLQGGRYKRYKVLCKMQGARYCVCIVQAGFLKLAMKFDYLNRYIHGRLTERLILSRCRDDNKGPHDIAQLAKNSAENSCLK
jgi:hypothetical protein